jgi:pyruvate/2-oxoglutarate dehydrogenase complex dihydrolipoamide acyltransferase (E2) component
MARRKKECIAFAATMRGMTLPIRPLLIALCTMLPLAAVAQDSNPAPPASSPDVVQAAPAAETPEQAREREAKEAQYLQWFNMLDLNHDGCVSREEAQSAIHQSPLLGLFATKLMQDFDEADAIRHSGCITPSDIRAVAAHRRAERQAKRAAEAQQKAAQTPETTTQDAPIH